MNSMPFVLPTLTNHQAEFAAMHHALEFLLTKEWQDQTIMLYTDSKVVAQTIDKNDTNNPDFSEVFRGNPRVAALFHFTDCPMDSPNLKTKVPTIWPVKG